MAKFTMTQFRALKRYPNGDIEDLQMNQIQMTTAQRDLVSEDDHARLIENDAEMRYMMAELEAEFG